MIFAFRSNSRAESLVLSSQLHGLREDEVPDNLFRDNPITLNFSFPVVCPYTSLKKQGSEHFAFKIVCSEMCFTMNCTYDPSNAEFSHE